MAQDDIDRVYQRLMDESRETGDLDTGGPGADRRGQPRVKANATMLTVRAELRVSAIDVSVSGLAFFSDFPVQIGQPLNITVGNLFTVDVEVVSCRLEPSDADASQPVYRVQCRFYEEEQGKYLLVTIKELDKKKAKE